MGLEAHRRWWQLALVPFGGNWTCQRSNVGFLTLVLWCGGRVLKKRVLQPIVGRAALGGDFSCSFAGGDRAIEF